jgi:hypothetical protein
MFRRINVDVGFYTLKGKTYHESNEVGAMNGIIFVLGGGRS